MISDHQEKAYVPHHHYTLSNLDQVSVREKTLSKTSNVSLININKTKTLEENSDKEC